MKIEAITLALAGVAAKTDDIYHRNRRSNQFLPRKMEQLSAMFQKAHGMSNYLKTYGYGCYCLNLGEKPMTGLVSGVEPIDEMDRHCYRYTQCIKCLKIDHGDHCTPENAKYEYSYGENDAIQCDNPVDSCRYNLCECDRMLVEGFGDKFKHHNPDYHIFGDFDFQTQCEERKHDGNDVINETPRVPQCCGEYPNRKAFMAGGAKDKVCCTNVTPNIAMVRSECDALPTADVPTDQD